MFWRKKPKEKDEDPFRLSFDEGPRASFRVTPAPDRPILFRFSGKTYTVLDISAGGLAIKASALAPGTTLGGTLLLPGRTAQMPCVLVVLQQSAQGVTSCRFHKIRPPDQELIHLYVLNRQKEELAEARLRTKEKE